MGEVRDNDIGFTWDEWESEFRGVVGEMTDEEWGKLDDNLTWMEEQEEGIFAEIKKHSEMTNNKGKIVEAIVVENKTVNRPNDNDSVGVEEKEYTLNDIFNLINKRFDEMDKMMDKRFDELHTGLDETKEVMDKGLDMMKKHLNEIDKK